MHIATITKVLCVLMAWVVIGVGLTLLVTAPATALSVPAMKLWNMEVGAGRIPTGIVFLALGAFLMVVFIQALPTPRTGKLRRDSGHTLGRNGPYGGPSASPINMFGGLWTLAAFVGVAVGYLAAPLVVHDYGVRVRVPEVIASVLIILLVATLVVRCSEAGAASPRTIVGKATVTDGDTIKISGQRIRLWGVDAPERRQACGSVKAGQQSASALVPLAQGKTATCDVRDIDRNGRPVALCRASGVDLGAAQVRAGWAWDWPQYSKGFYSGEERAAKSGGRGVWALTCEKPWDYRRRQ